MRALVVLLLGNLASAQHLASAQQLPGVRVWVSHRLLDYAQTAVVPELISQLSHLSIPDISGEKHSIEYSFTQFKLGSVSVTPNFGFVGGGIHMAVGGITTSISCDWHYKEKHWPHVPEGSGTAKIDIGSGTKVDVTLVPSVGPDGKPVLTLSGLTVNLDLGHISIHGSMLSWLYDVLIDLVKSSIEKAVSDGLESAVRDFVTQDLAKILSSLDLVVPLHLGNPTYDIADIDFSLKKFNVTTSHLTADAKGEIVSRNKSDPDTFPDRPPVLPDSPPSAFDQYMISFSVKDWVIKCAGPGLDPTSCPAGCESPLPATSPSLACCSPAQRPSDRAASSCPHSSGLWLFWTKGLLIDTIYPSNVPSGFPVQLTTASFASIAPQLPALYPGRNLSMTVSASGQPKVTFDANGTNAMKTSIPTQLNFSVLLGNGSSAPAFALSVPVVVANHAWVARPPGAPEVVHGNISLLECTPLTELTSAVGSVRVAGVSSLIGFLLSHVVVPAANKMIAPGLPVTNTSAGVALHRLDLEIEDDALQVRADFTYAPPPRPRPVSVRATPTAAALADTHRPAVKGH